MANSLLSFSLGGASPSSGNVTLQPTNRHVQTDINICRHTQTCTIDLHSHVKTDIPSQRSPWLFGGVVSFQTLTGLISASWDTSQWLFLKVLSSFASDFLPCRRTVAQSAPLVSKRILCWVSNSLNSASVLLLLLPPPPPHSARSLPSLSSLRPNHSVLSALYSNSA